MVVSGTNRINQTRQLRLFSNGLHDFWNGETITTVLEFEGIDILECDCEIIECKNSIISRQKWNMKILKRRLLTLILLFDVVTLIRVQFKSREKIIRNSKLFSF